MGVRAYKELYAVIRELQNEIKSGHMYPHKG
jgi:hypothetical protein